MSSNPFLSTTPDWDELGIDPNAEIGIDNDAYVPSSQYPPPPPIGNCEYCGIAESYTWGRDTNKNLYLRGNGQIVGGEYDGRRVDLFISNRPPVFRPDGSDLEDFIRAVGATPANGKRFTASEIVRIVEETWTKTRKGWLNWEGWCSNCQKTVARGKTGGKKTDATGFRVVGFQRGDALVPSIACPICGNIVSARARIQKFYV